MPAGLSARFNLKQEGAAVSVRNWVGGVVLAGTAAGLALTNPEPSAYEQYATSRLSDYLAVNLCDDIPPNLNQVLQNQCRSLLENNQTQVRQLIANHTTRSNYGLFSLYRTRLEAPGLPLLPSYEFETLGIGRSFFTYRAGKG